MDRDVAGPALLATTASCGTMCPITPETELTICPIFDHLTLGRNSFGVTRIAWLNILHRTLARNATAFRIVRNFAEAMPGTETVRAAIRPCIPICELTVLRLQTSYPFALLDLAVETSDW